MGQIWLPPPLLLLPPLLTKQLAIAQALGIETVGLKPLATELWAFHSYLGAQYQPLSASLFWFLNSGGHRTRAIWGRSVNFFPCNRICCGLGKQTSFLLTAGTNQLYFFWRVPKTLGLPAVFSLLGLKFLSIFFFFHSAKRSYGKIRSWGSYEHRTQNLVSRQQNK